MSLEDKVIMVIEQLIKLLSLSELEIEKEFQKEFLFYWDMQTTNMPAIKIYIGYDRVFQKMNVYLNKDASIRIVSNGIKLNDKDKKEDEKRVWEYKYKAPGYYIPIIDNRRIKPPTKDATWTEKDIKKIIQGRDIKRISHDTYEKLTHEKIKTKSVCLIFEMNVEGNAINFCCFIKFKNAIQETLFQKLSTAIVSIEPVRSIRCDFYFLNKQIGNDICVINKKIAVIGAGSLGSYISTELVKSGMRNLTIYDADDLQEANVLRHTIKNSWSGLPKVIAMKCDLEKIHPEIEINIVNKYMTSSRLKEDMDKYDMIIFTVGSSDVQLLCNKIFKTEKYDKLIIYAWLEAGGTNSHILKVDYSKKGCFECLYTDEEGNLVNNKMNKLSDEQIEASTIRNGCGGTRVAYGTEILLRTTSVLLDTVKKTLRGEFEDNCLIDIEFYSVVNRGNAFIEGKCKCCCD